MLVRPVLLMLGLMAAAVAPASAATRKPSYGKLTERLGELAAPGVRTASPAKQADAVDLPRGGPASLVRSGDDVVVEIRVSGAAAVDALRAAGARVLHVSDRYDTVSAAVDPRDLKAVAAVQGVEGVTESLAPMRAALNNCVGARTSEGDAQLRAAAARSSMEVDGAGVKVGLLSDSFNRSGGAANDIASGDLPGAGNPCGRTGAVQDLVDSANGADEGRAMAQIVHDLAPGASLAFATGNDTITQFADHIRSLRAAGAKVIVDDLAYFSEPFFQDGPVSVAANEVTAQGVSYFAAAMNNNLRSGSNDVPSWESPQFRGTGSCPAGLPASVPVSSQDCEDFDPGAGTDTEFSITVAARDTLTIDLQWAEPWNGVTTDIDAYLLGTGEAVAPAAEDDNLATQRPFELLSWDNTSASPRTVRLVINRFAGSATPRLKFTLAQNGGGALPMEYLASGGGDIVGPSIFGHSGAASVTSVAAVPYTDANTIEPYSSRGPMTLYFGPVSGSAPAAPLGTPQVNAKPDLAATDCGLNTFFGPIFSGGRRFCGTSAAAPHAAAVAALLLQANPSLTPAQVRAALVASARPVGLFGPAAAGAGLIDALPAVKGVALPPVVSITPPAALTANRTPTISFGANRPATFSCSLDGAAAQPCSSPFTTPALADGPHSFSVSGSDAAGRSGAAAPVSFSVDTTPPDTSVTSGPSGFTRNARPAFAFSTADRGATFECRFDVEPFAACSGPGASHRPGAPLGQGAHRFDVRAVDSAGNPDPAPALRRFSVDSVRPRATILRHPARRSARRVARFVLRGSEARVTFQCKLDRTPFRRCSSRPRFRLSGGRHRLRLRVLDRAGNRSKAKTFRWTVL